MRRYGTAAINVDLNVQRFRIFFNQSPVSIAVGNHVGIPGTGLSFFVIVFYGVNSLPGLVIWLGR